MSNPFVVRLKEIDDGETLEIFQGFFGASCFVSSFVSLLDIDRNHDRDAR